MPGHSRAGGLIQGLSAVEEGPSKGTPSPVTGLSMPGKLGFSPGRESLNFSEVPVGPCGALGGLGWCTAVSGYLQQWTWAGGEGKAALGVASDPLFHHCLFDRGRSLTELGFLGL